MYNATKLLNLFAKPFKLFFTDAVVFRVSRFDVGFPELLEPRAILTIVARPDERQAIIDPLSLRTQEAQIVHVGRVESADEKDAVVEGLCPLMQRKAAFFQSPSDI